MPVVVPRYSPCPYCEHFAGREPCDDPLAVVVEDDAAWVFLARRSLGGMEGHALVVVRRHVETIFDLSRDEESALMYVIARTARAVRSAFDPDGVLLLQRNGEAAGQTVPHVHFHVIPQRKGASFPPAPQPEITPAAERALLARELRQRWGEAGKP